MIWRVPCKIHPVKPTQIFSGWSPDFLLIYEYDTQLFSGCLPEKNLGRFYRVDFTGYPSNQFSGYRLNGRVIKVWLCSQKFKSRIVSIWHIFFRLAAARKDAAQSVELMRERYLTICSNETDKNGLVIIVALYGKIFNGNYQSGHHEIRGRL